MVRNDARRHAPVQHTTPPMRTTPTASTSSSATPELANQTVVVLGGTAGIGIAIARHARAEGAEVIITGRDPDRLRRAEEELAPRQTAAFDAGDPDAVARFFDSITGPIDHVVVTAGRPHYGPLLGMDTATLREALSAHIVMAVDVARNAASKLQAGGSLVLMGGTGARRVSRELGIASAVTVALPTVTASLALELAPARANLIAAGFVDTPLSAALLGEQLDARREQLRRTLPIGRVVGPDDIAAVAVQLMTNTAITGATIDLDGGQQFVEPAPSGT
jgi:NAD(P)-dependent dehydrogenase (short-subunit alcohol dehydrogenase family)